MRLNASAFNRMLTANGQTFGLRRGFACPCTTNGSGQPKSTCKQCSGKGRLWGKGVVNGAAGIVSQAKMRSFAAFGVWDKDDIMLSIPSNSPLYAMGQYDRVMAVNRSEPFSMSLKRGLNDTLRLPVVSLERCFWLDASEEIREASLPTVSPDGVLSWSGVAPPAGVTFSLTGRRRPEYFCFVELPTDRPMHHGEPLPRRVALRRFDLFGR